MSEWVRVRLWRERMLLSLALTNVVWCGIILEHTHKQLCVRNKRRFCLAQCAVKHSFRHATTNKKYSSSSNETQIYEWRRICWRTELICLCCDTKLLHDIHFEPPKRSKALFTTYHNRMPLFLCILSMWNLPSALGWKIWFIQMEFLMRLYEIFDELWMMRIK